MATTPVIRYDLDKTGLSASNLIVDEPHVLQAGATRSLAPKYGAFFTESVIVKDADTGITLTRGVDYICVELLQEASIISAKEICYLILVKNVSVSSNVTVTYQVLGGLYTRSADAIGEYYDQITAAGSSVNWGDVLNKPFVYPPTDHLHDGADLYGFEYLVDSLERIRQAILLGNVPALDAMLQTNTATTAQTIAGTLSTKYVTPEGLKDTLNGGANYAINLNGGVVVVDGDIDVGHGNAANANRATNLSIGFGAGAVDLATYNTFIGNYVGNSNTTGSNNTASGYNALKFNTTGAGNTAFGTSALRENTTGDKNTATGHSSLNQNTTGSFNAAIGNSSLKYNTTGSNNTAVGVSSLLWNTTGNNNTGIGSNSLEANTTGASNTANGFSALYSNTTGNGNTAFGWRAMNSNTTGGDNVAVGDNALYNNTVGIQNTALGSSTLSSLTSGNGNIAIGDAALIIATSGSDNIAIGRKCMQTYLSGNNNISIGSYVNPSSGTASNQITLGNSSNTVLRCAVTSITALSDERDKKDWSALGDSLNFINTLQPQRFVWNERTGERVDIADTGFSAQQLKSAQEQTGYHIPGLVFEENPEKLEAAYSKLLPTMVDAMKQLIEKNQLLAEQNHQLRQELNDIKEQIASFKQFGQFC